MRRRIVFSPEAETQLLDIFQYIAEAASPETAERFTASVVYTWSHNLDEVTQFRGQLPQQSGAKIE